MTGFYISNILNKPVSFIKERDAILEEIPCRNHVIMRSTTLKFADDKLFCEDDDYIIILEGVVLNLSELKAKYSVGSAYELLCTMICENGETFMSELIGMFAGAVYFKVTDTWIVYTNQHSSKMLFYYMDKDGRFAIAPMATHITDILRGEGIGYSFNRNAAYLIMNYGYIGTKADTFVSEVKRVGAGEMLRIAGGRAETITYHRYRLFKYDLSLCSEDEIIDGIDMRYRKAIQLTYEKDIEYGYNTHLRALTGGMDSRAAVFVARDMGYTNAVNVTYGPLGTADEQIARQISLFMGTNIVFMSTATDNSTVESLHDIDNIAHRFQGLQYFMSGFHLPALSMLDSSCHGLFHGAPLSEVVLTTNLDGLKMTPPSTPLRTYGKLLVKKCPSEHFEEYENEYIYMLYSTHFYKFLVSLGLGNCEDSYPCIDPELIDYCLSIPVHMREKYYIYYKWLFTKYPDAKKFKLEKLNAKVDSNRLVKWWGKVTRYGPPVQYLRCSNNPFPKKMRELFNLDKRIKPSPVALHPYDYWYKHDTVLRQNMDNYFKAYINHSLIDDELRDDLDLVYKGDKAQLKSMVITVLSAVKLFFPHILT